MAGSDNFLDEEALRLYREFGGLDEREVQKSLLQSSVNSSESMDQEERVRDAFRAQLIDFFHLFGGLLRDTRFAETGAGSKKPITDLIGLLAGLERLPGNDGTLWVRYRGHRGAPGVSSDVDYVVMAGNLQLDIPGVSHLIKRQGIQASHLTGRLVRSFQILSDFGIHHLSFKIPRDAGERKNLEESVEILPRFYRCIKTDTPLSIVKDGKPLPILVRNELGQPDVNLTLAAALSAIKAETMESLVRQVGDRLRRTDADRSFPSAAEALFRVKSLQGKLVKPPVEINSVRWLMVSGDQPISREKAELGKLVMGGHGNSIKTAAKILNSVYGDDFKGIGSEDFGERIQMVSGLMAHIETSVEPDKKAAHTDEVLNNLRQRFNQVQEGIYDGLVVDRNTVRIGTGEKEAVIEKVHSAILKVLSFCKRRVETRKKVKNLIAGSSPFDDQDFEALALDFGISAMDARRLVELLKSSFDARGRFSREAFERNIPELSRYEEKIFEFLWHFLKETRNRTDRVAFLNSLQVLILRMQKPVEAIQTLLSDVTRDPSTVDFSARNAVMLAIILLRKYNKELTLDIEITPEEVLLVKDGLNPETARSVSESLDADPEGFFESVRTVRRKLAQALDPEHADGQPMPFRYLLSLEREFHIFLALVAGRTAVAVLRGALETYGNPDHPIYHLPESPNHLGAFLQHLRLAIRAMGRLGGPADLELMEGIRQKKEGFLTLGKRPVHGELVSRNLDWIESAVNGIRERAALSSER